MKPLSATIPGRAAAAIVALIAVLIVWSYWPTFMTMAGQWSSDPQYSHGYLVPLFAAVLLWARRSRLPGSFQPTWWGLPILVLGVALRLLGGYLYFDWFDAISLLPTLTGLCLLIGGWGTLVWSWPAIVFLLFMVPLPFRLEHALGAELQALATKASTYVLQGLGLPALAEGNVIVLNEVRIGVVEACSGLSMMMVFFAEAVAVALLVRRPLVDRVVIVLSAAPIAIAVNVIRIVVTAILHVNVGRETADAFFHDLAGWLMMPVALAFLGLELWLLSRLFVPVEPRQPMPLVLGEARAKSRSSEQAVAPLT